MHGGMSSWLYVPAVQSSQLSQLKLTADTCRDTAVALVLASWLGQLLSDSLLVAMLVRLAMARGMLVSSSA